MEEAELIEANPRYAHVMLNDGRKITVSLRDLAPNPESLLGQNHNAEATEKDADDIPSLDHNETSAQTEQNTGDVAVHSSLESHDFDVRSLHVLSFSSLPSYPPVTFTTSHIIPITYYYTVLIHHLIQIESQLISRNKS